MHLTMQQLLDLVRDPLSGFGVLRVELGFSGLPEIFQHVNDIQDHDHTHAIGVGVSPQKSEAESPCPRELSRRREAGIMARHRCNFSPPEPAALCSKTLTCTA